jgi:hypothetical protein
MPDWRTIGLAVAELLTYALGLAILWGGVVYGYHYLGE